MNNFARIFILLLLFSLQPLTAQQWERLPLNGGHLDRLIVNPYNDQEIYGYIQEKDIYRSTDGGLQWHRINGSVVPFQRTFIHLTIDTLDRIYLITLDGLWRSSDGGGEWVRLSLPSVNDFKAMSQVEVSKSGIITVWNSMAGKMHRSTDDGNSWERIQTRDRSFIKKFFQHSNNPALMVVQTSNSFLTTANSGLDWEEISPQVEVNSDFSVIIATNTLVFRFASGPESIDIYESRDTCKSWKKLTETQIQSEDGDFSVGPSTFSVFQMNDSVIIVNRNRILFFSVDSGRSFSRISDARFVDLAHAGAGILASVPMEGLLRSTDCGATWSHVPGQPAILNFGEMEFAHAQDDTMFVLLSDSWKPGHRTSWFFESDDGGMTWRKLFDSRTVYDLSVDAGRPARYYLLAAESLERWSIITGVAGQTKPDTVHTYNPNRHKWDPLRPMSFSCIPSRRFPGFVYASKYNATVGISPDRGTTWEWSSVSYRLTGVRPWGSQFDPYRIVVTGWTDDWNYTEREGIYYTATGGAPFEFMNANLFLAAYAKVLHISPEDRYFLHEVPDSASADYGRTWITMRDGLDQGTSNLRIYQSHGDVLLRTTTGMYRFRNDRWEHLRTPDGNPLRADEPLEFGEATAISMEMNDKYLYALIPTYGLFRTPVGFTTHTASQPDIGSIRMDLYPNPSASDVTIRWSGYDGSLVTITVVDCLGREIRRLTSEGNAGTIIWKGTREDESRVPPGMYVVRILGDRTCDVEILILR